MSTLTLLSNRDHCYRVRVKVDFNREWQYALDTAGPNTPNDLTIRKAADLFPGTSTGIVEKEIILINFHEGGGSFYEACMWAEKCDLKLTHPREIFAIGEQFPDFHRRVQFDPAYAVATKECKFKNRPHICHVWWSDSGRGVRMKRTRSLTDPHVFFTFSRS